MNQLSEKKNELLTTLHNLDHFYETSNDKINKIMDEIGSNDLENINNLKKCINGIVQNYKEFSPIIIKIGKSIKKNISFNVKEEIYLPSFDEANCKIIKQEILNHSGLVFHDSIRKQINSEREIKDFETIKKQLILIRNILEDLENKKVDSAISWCESIISNDRSLINLKFKLFKLKYISLLHCGKHKEAISLLKKIKINYPQNHKEITILSGCLAFNNSNFSTCYYSYLYNDNSWQSAYFLFKDISLNLLKIPIISSFYIAVLSGFETFNTLFKHSKLVKTNSSHKVNKYTNSEELPFEVIFTDNIFSFHSVFSCPILRQQTSLANPPIRLTCGHVISENALKTIVQNNLIIKCPYCPEEVTVLKTIKLEF